MPNKTIYISQNDVPVFEQAQQIAGEALSSVIAKALREYVARHQERDKGMKEVSVKVGAKGSEREQRFIASYLGKWKGLSEDKAWWLEAGIYRTQKGNWAVYLEHKGKTSVVTNPKAWIKNGDYLADERYTELIVGVTPAEFADKLPKALIEHINNLREREKSPVDYLDI
jgi:EXLDI family protein